MSRTYGFRLKPAPGEPDWSDALWTTHVAVNVGARAFGDWLLTMRGGLDHRLADAIESAPARRLRRRLLALGWVSPESAIGAPERWRVPESETGDQDTIGALAAILAARGVAGETIESWVADCRPTLTADIREDAVWVDRSRAFDEVTANVDAEAARADAWRLLVSLYGADYLPEAAPGETEEAVAASGAGAGQRTRHLYSHLFGRSEAYGSPPVSLALRGHWSAHLEREVGAAGVPLRWEPGDDAKARRAAGERSPAEFPRLMLALAAANVAKAHSRTLSQEAARLTTARAEERLLEIERDPSLAPALAGLAEYCRARAEELGSRREYRIFPRQTTAWADVVTAWSEVRAEDPALAAETRRELARAAQSKSESKFGDPTLFDELAAARYEPLWRSEGGTRPEVLTAYAAGQAARLRASQLKASAYRHPDACGAPFFARFGDSKPDVWFGRVDPGADAREVRLLVWDGRRAFVARMRAVSERVEREIGRAPAGGRAGLPESVSRDTRLGRAAASVTGDAPVVAAGVFAWREVKARPKKDAEGQAVVATEPDRTEAAAKRAPEWAAQLVADRDELAAIAGTPQPGARRRRALGWRLQVPLQLVPRGPFLDYATRTGLELDRRSGEWQPAPRDGRNAWRGLAWPFWHPANEGRSGRAKLGLARLPGLRLLGVKLVGSPYSAACALWETTTGEEASRAAGRAGIATPTEATVGFVADKPYRRIGPDRLADGSEHPAPWARLERQFTLRLAGEGDVRAASPKEMWLAHEIERRLGWRRPLLDRLVAGGWGRTEEQAARLAAVERLGWQRPAEEGRLATRARQRWLGVDALQATSLRAARLALERQRQRALVAWGLVSRERLLPGRRRVALDDRGRVELLTDTLVAWRTLAASTKYDDPVARDLWNRHVGPLLADRDPDSPDAVLGLTLPKEELRRAARTLAGRDLEDLSALWTARWQEVEAEWRWVMAALRGWIAPNREPEVLADLFHTGGLSLARIERFSDLHRLMRAVRMQAAPSDPEANALGEGDPTSAGLGRRVLESAERLRRDRVRQLASRVVSAALGLDARGRSLYAPVHAVVIEDLGGLSPEQTRGRRANRAIVERSAAAIRDRIAEGCQLHGLHLRAVAPAFSNRRSSRTGLPGLVAREVEVAALVARAESGDRRPRRAGDAPSILFERGALDAHWDARTRVWRDAEGAWVLKDDGAWTPPAGLARAATPPRPKPVYAPDPYGARFVSVDSAGRLENLCVRVNAAANLGLDALLDPDWPGAWWRLPIDASSGQPAKDLAGCPAVDTNAVVRAPAAAAPAARTGKGRRGVPRRPASTTKIVVLWRDPTARPVAEGPWEDFAPYWTGVERRVVEALLARLRGRKERS